MIRINIENIKNWELIKRYHEKYYNETVGKILENQVECTALIEKEIKNINVKDGIDVVVLTSNIDLYLYIARFIFRKMNLATGDISILKKAIEINNQIMFILETELEKKIIKNILKEIFNYEKFNDGRILSLDGKKRRWCRHELLSLMDIRTCPYCNRQYITNYLGIDEVHKTTADIDHFFLQSGYPFLALSLYNFIPSCQICNSRMKGKVFEADDHIYPYEEEFGSNGKFSVNSSDLNFLWEDTSEFDIVIEPKSGCSEEAKIKKSIETFKIKEVYQTHKDYVQEIIKKAMIYDEAAIKNIKTQYPDLFKTEKEIWQCVMGNYLCEEELGKRPLAKLTKDISEEFGITI